MKILWFTNTPCNWPGAASASGGGWMQSLESEIRTRDGVELSVSFFVPESRGHSRQTAAAGYRPMFRPVGIGARCFRFFRFSAQDILDIRHCLSVVREFRPDLVHVFGTEGSFGLVSGSLDVPVVIHLQGLMGPYWNAWVPPGCCLWDYVRAGGCTPLRLAMGFRALAFNRHSVSRERVIMKKCRFFMGRTEWDRAYVSLYAPHACYFHCEEALRPDFFVPGKRRSKRPSIFVSTLSGPLYKGHDVILKTAKVLCETGHGDFEWRVFGVADCKFAERKTGIRSVDVHVRPMGRVSASVLRGELLSCTAYVHPSYIDNSPNSVCEAQVSAVPVVAANVGGVSSIVEEGKTGFLVPPNDPVALARRMVDLASGVLNLPDGWESGPRARHDPGRVADRVLEIYRSILSST